MVKVDPKAPRTDTTRTGSVGGADTQTGLPAGAPARGGAHIPSASDAARLNKLTGPTTGGLGRAAARIGGANPAEFPAGGVNASFDGHIERTVVEGEVPVAELNAVFQSVVREP